MKVIDKMIDVYLNSLEMFFFSVELIEELFYPKSGFSFFLHPE